MNIVTTTLRALHTEAIKLKGTLALWMCLIAPLTIVTLSVLLIGLNSNSRLPKDASAFWYSHVRSNYAFWGLLMLPLFVTLEAALLAQLEHANLRWKHLLALPVPRASHYLAKGVALALLVALATIAMMLLLPISAWALDALRPEYVPNGHVPIDVLLKMGASMWLAGLLMVAIHTWAAQRWSSFTVAVSIGITATVVGFLMSQSSRFAHWFPWSMPVQFAANGSEHLTFALTAGSLGGIVLLLLGAWGFARREHG